MISKTLTITRGAVFTDYVYIPDSADPTIGMDFTGYTIKSEVRDKPNGTLLATLTATPDTPPAANMPAKGWVKLSLDDGTTIPAGYRGTWSLMAGNGGNNPITLSAGPVDIISLATQWA